MAADQKLDLEITINAPVPIVWMAFANDQFFGSWYTPNPDWVPDLRTFSFEVGGAREIAFGPVGEEPYVEKDEILEIVDYQKIVFTTDMSQGDITYNHTHCTLTLAPLDGGKTALHLIETGIDADEVEPRREGWTGTFNNLNAQLKDDGHPQIWHETFDAPISRVWQALTSKDDVARWFSPFPGAPIDVHECGYGVGEKRNITFGKGEDWEHTIIETYVEIDEGRGCTFAVDMIADGYNFSTLTGKIGLVGLDDGKTTMFLTITGGPPQERAVRANGWGMTLANMATVL